MNLISRLKQITSASPKEKLVKSAAGFSLLFLSLAITYSIFPGFLKLSSPQSTSRPVHKTRPAIYEGISIKGLSLDEYEQDEKLFSVEIGSLRVKRKKVDPFKIGLWKVAELSNVTLSLNEKYVAPPESKTPAAPDQKDPSSADLVSHIISNAQVIPLGLDKVKDVQFDNLMVNIVRDHEIISSISSAQAQLDPLKKKIVLQGQVKIATRNNGVLTCNELHYTEQSKEFETEGLYALTTGEKIYKGKGIKTNYLLEGIHPTKS